MTEDKRFYDQCSQREMKLMMSGPYEGWLVYRHPDGQWVTLREATFEEKMRLRVIEA